MIDGGIDPWDMVPTFKLNDLLKTHTEFSDSSLSTTTFVLAMNKATYDKLPRELKTVIDNNSGQPAATIAGAMWDVQAAAVVDMVGGRGDPITTLLPEAVARWRKATEPVIEAWLKDMKEHKVDGAKLLANARALLAKYAGEPEPQPAQPVREPQPAEAKAEPTTPPKVEATSSTPQPSTPTPPKPAVKPTVRHHAGNPADTRADGGRAISRPCGQARSADHTASPGNSLGDAGANSCSGRTARCGSGSAAASAGRKSPAGGATDTARCGGTRSGASAAAEDSRYSALVGFAVPRAIAAADGRASARKDVSSPAAP